MDLFERLRLQMWLIPAIFGLGAVALAVVLLYLDDAFSLSSAGMPFLFGGGAEGARSMLSTIATAMLTFTGLVFTVTMLVLQQASMQHSPRVMRTFLRDRKNQSVLGLFVATFLFTLVVLRQMRGETDDLDGFIPELSITVAFVLLVGSVAAFVFYIDHMANAIRATTILDNIADEARAAIDELFPEPVGEALEEDAWSEQPDVPPQATIRSKVSGVITGVDAGRLLAAASTITQRRDRPPDALAGARFVEMVPMVGDYVTDQSVLFRVWGEWTERELRSLHDSIDIGAERTVEQDAAFGLRQLIDVAMRALSPSMNDPTTAVQSLHRIHQLMQQLVTREIPPAIRRDDAGTARLLLPRPSWDDYVLLATEEIRLVGGTHVQVMRRLRQMIFSLLDHAPPSRQPVLRRQLLVIEESIERNFSDQLDRRAAAADGGTGQTTISTLTR